MAHLVEHVTFLGSAKRERMLGTGARSNAYTDFHHTVFHIHSPLVNEHSPFSRKPMLPEVLLALIITPRFIGGLSTHCCLRIPLVELQ